MKTKIFILVIFSLPVFVWGQEKNVPPFIIETVNSSPPHFTGVKSGKKLADKGKNDNLLSYVKNNTIIPDEVTKCKFEGKEVVHFTITSGGELTGFKIINSICPSVDKEVLRVLKTTIGMWNPGYQNNVPVDMEKEIAIEFIANNNNLKDPEAYLTKMAISNFNKANELFVLKNNAKKALKYYNNSIKYLPDETASLLQRGLCKYQLGDTEGALNDWNRIKTLGKMDVSEFLNNLNEKNGFAQMINTLQVE